MVRDRIEALLDPGTDFFELSPLAGYQLYEEQTPSGGIVTGVGSISGLYTMIIANDFTVKAGSYFPITVKKHLRAQMIAEQNHLPCLYLVDSGGAYLPMQDEVYPDRLDFGRLFYQQAHMSAKGLTQIAIVLGSCTAGGAYIPAMCDQTIMVKDQATVFLGGPPLVKAATGETVTAEALGGAYLHHRYSGVADYMVDSEDEAFLKARSIMAHQSHLKRGAKKPLYIQEKIKKPRYDSDSILGLIPPTLNQSFPMLDLIAFMVDGSYFESFKKLYSKTLICGFAQLYGFQVGIIANQGILFSESALKATHFIQLCNQRGIPLIFLQHVPGFMVGQHYEKSGIAKHGANMVTAVATAKVPKLTVVLGGSFGAGNYCMCGRAYDPRFMFLWPHARLSVMGASQAASVLTQVKSDQNPEISHDQLDSMKQSIFDSYETSGSAYNSTAHLWDDGIIDPRQTRDVLGQALQFIQYSDWDHHTNMGIFRM